MVNPEHKWVQSRSSKHPRISASSKNPQQITPNHPTACLEGMKQDLGVEVSQPLFAILQPRLPFAMKRCVVPCLGEMDLGSHGMLSALCLRHISACYGTSMGLVPAEPGSCCDHGCWSRAGAMVQGPVLGPC